MAWFPRVSRLMDAVAANAPDVRDYGPVVAGVPSTWQDFTSYRGLWAMQVPAYNRGVSLISGTIAQLPLTLWDTPNRVSAAFLAQPEEKRPAWVTKQRTIQDMIGFGVAYWRISRVESGRVRYVTQIPADGITAQVNGTLTTATGETLYPSDPTLPPLAGRVIVIDGFREGSLTTGVDVITTALALEAAALNYAETPHPGDVLINQSNYEMSSSEIDEMLAKWSQARRDSAAAYLNAGVSLGDSKGWSPTELALVDQRNQSAIQIARLLNLDAMWVGATVGGSSLTYQNRVDARTDLYGMTLAAYIVPLEQRLSMADVTGGTVSMDASAFLRANLDSRVTMAVSMVTAGILSPAEARAWISDRPTGGPTK